MKLFIGGSPFNIAIEAEFEDAWEEIEEFPPMSENEDSYAFIGLEDENHNIMNIVHLTPDEWGVISSDVEKRNINAETLKEIVQNFCEGKLPDWFGKPRNDFPDGIDDILENSW
jgi:hypothetical protein